MNAAQVIVATPEQLTSMVFDAVRAALGSCSLSGGSELDSLRKKALLTPAEVEALYGLNARTLANKRQNGRGPAYMQEGEGGAVYYQHEDIQAYITLCRRKTYESSTM